jgi:hypothetical protein
MREDHAWFRSLGQRLRVKRRGTVDAKEVVAQEIDDETFS